MKAYRTILIAVVIFGIGGVFGSTSANADAVIHLLQDRLEMKLEAWFEGYPGVPRFVETYIGPAYSNAGGTAIETVVEGRIHEEVGGIVGPIRNKSRTSSLNTESPFQLYLAFSPPGHTRYFFIPSIVGN